MGTDIHMQVERRAEGKWLRVPHPDLPCDAMFCVDGKYGPETPNVKVRGEDCYSCKGAGHYRRSFYHDRNYNVFAILADVRNGTGFAGIDTGDGFVPISTPRGFPDDLSDGIRALVALSDSDDEEDDYDYNDPDEQERHFYMGDHSFSWVTVTELLAYDWDRTTTLRGWVDAWNFELWRREGHPRNWSGGITGPNIEHVSNAHVARMIDTREIIFEGDDADWIGRTGWDERSYTTPLQRSMKTIGNFPEGSVGQQMVERGERYYTNVAWTKTYRECAAGFLEILHRDLVPLGDPSDVRLVFGFDS